MWYKEVDGKKLLRLLIGIGVNGSGKSKMISALDYFRNLAINKPNDPNDLPLYKPFELDEDTKSQPTEMALYYYINDEDYYHYKFTVSALRIESEELNVMMNKKFAKIYSRRYDEEKNTVVIDFGAICDLSKDDKRGLEINTLSNATVMATFGALNIESKIFKANYDFFYNKISVVKRSRITLAEKLKTDDPIKDAVMKRLVLQLLKDIGTNITNYKVSEITISFDELAKQAPNFIQDILKTKYVNGLKQKMLHFEHTTDEGKALLPSELESMGTINIVILLVVLYDIILLKKTSCIDEIEQGIHTVALEFILYMYLVLADDCQILIVTHDLNILRSNFLKRDAIRLFEKDSHGSTHVNRPGYLHQTSSFYNFYINKVGEKIKGMMDNESIRQTYRDLLKQD
jgi:AAA15 family ATPase/GTPase